MNYVLLIHGPDSKGLIYHVTSVLFHHQCNILRQDEYVSQQGMFFMRTVVEAPDTLNLQTIQDLLTHALPSTMSVRVTLQSKKNIVVLATKEHHCLSDLLIRHAFDELNATIVAVISNYYTLQPLVAKFDIPFYCVPTQPQQTRQAHENAIINIIKKYNPEYLVLAKYMRVLSSTFVGLFNQKIVNIHHSFLPAFIGANPYKQAFERGVKIIGATAHFVTATLDDGPIIAQGIKEVTHRHTAQEMAKEGREIEKLVLANALSFVFNDKVFIHQNSTVIL